jgi:hypothetical protein
MTSTQPHAAKMRATGAKKKMANKAKGKLIAKR